MTWNAPLGLWPLLYDAGSPRGINARVAREPWGPWSEPVVVFDPDQPETGHGMLMHVNDEPDNLSEPGRSTSGAARTGPP